MNVKTRRIEMGELKAVKSKYTNPDKYISRQKYEIVCLNTSIRNRDREIENLKKENAALKSDAYGDYWFTFQDPGHKIGVDLNGHNAIGALDSLKIGTKVICIGEVVEFTRSKDGKNGAYIHIKDIHLKK
jgi:hypothetical protein